MPELQEVIVSASATSLQVHDALSGSLLTTFKLPNVPDNASAAALHRRLTGCLTARNGLPNVICHVAGPNKGAAYFFNLSKVPRAFVRVFACPCWIFQGSAVLEQPTAYAFERAGCVTQRRISRGR
jgi:hypothetical protein